jgi:hypothetical protein
MAHINDGPEDADDWPEAEAVTPRQRRAAAAANRAQKVRRLAARYMEPGNHLQEAFLSMVLNSAWGASHRTAQAHWTVAQLRELTDVELHILEAIPRAIGKTPQGSGWHELAEVMHERGM